jgi:S-adenosylmethionine:tRNA ribosyltransferase-isomerase
VIELRSADGARPYRGGRVGDRFQLDGGAQIELVAPYTSGARLRLARVWAPEPVTDYLARHGEPIRYGYVEEGWPLDAYQTAYALTPGSAEMPSAGRPFTPELITRLVAGGVQVAPITLHTGVSSPERHEPPYPEFFELPASTARLVNAVRAWGGRVIAVGTTVVRALETTAGLDGTVTADAGWTNLVVTPERGLRAVDGLLTGWHEPAASHLQLLEAAAGRELLDRCYRAALEHGYLWHEFGDSHLILP